MKAREGVGIELHNFTDDEDSSQVEGHFCCHQIC